MKRGASKLDAHRSHRNVLKNLLPPEERILPDARDLPRWFNGKSNVGERRNLVKKKKRRRKKFSKVSNSLAWCNDTYRWMANCQCNGWNVWIIVNDWLFSWQGLGHWQFALDLEEELFFTLRFLNWNFQKVILFLIK